jgi:hypothetical protein
VLTKEQIKQVSLYSIVKKSNEDIFAEDLDNSSTDDAVLTAFIMDVSGMFARLPNKRALEFKPDSTVAGLIQTIIMHETDSAFFKAKTRAIAQQLFNATTLNAKRGDLLSVLFHPPGRFVIHLFKIDESRILKQQANGQWSQYAGLGVENRLQKGAYIEIPVVDGRADVDTARWTVTVIDNLSNENVFWNINFLQASYKRGDKVTNTQGFASFFKDFLDTVDDEEKKYDLNYKFSSYLNENDSVGYDHFVDNVFGSDDLYEDERRYFQSQFASAASGEEHGFDRDFEIDTRTAKKYGKMGSYIFDGKLKVTCNHQHFDHLDDPKRRLDRRIKLRDDAGNEFEEGGRKYAKIYYDHYAFDEK